MGNYSIGRLIGKGSFGKVYLATHKLTNGSKVYSWFLLSLYFFARSSFYGFMRNGGGLKGDGDSIGYGNGKRCGNRDRIGSDSGND